MDIYKLHYPGTIDIDNAEQYSLAVGFFDGLHKGHQTVIVEAKRKAEELGIRCSCYDIRSASLAFVRRG